MPVTAGTIITSGGGGDTASVSASAGGTLICIITAQKDGAGIWGPPSWYLGTDHDEALCVFGAETDAGDTTQIELLSVDPLEVGVRVCEVQVDGGGDGDSQLITITVTDDDEESGPVIADFDTVPNIATDFSAWLGWLSTRLGQFRAYCPLARGTAYYVSNSAGNDSNDGLSVTTPFKTLAKVQTALDGAASNADLRFRFLRGDEWAEATGLTVSVASVTLDDYGDGSAALPLFNRFIQDYTASTWTNAAGNRWTLAETHTIVWVREKLDRLGETRGTGLIRVASSGAVTSTANSWFWGSNVLHVNLNGDNPNTKKLEGVEQNSLTGIKLASAADGCRIRNIRADGWGAIGANLGYCFMSAVSGTNANLWENLEGYYSGTHIMGHLCSGASGGKLMAVGCKTGYGIDSGDEGQFIGFATSGSQEVWNIDGVSVYGDAKTSLWGYATDHNAGTAFAAHTTTGNPAMIVSHGLTVKQGLTGSVKSTSIAQSDGSTLTAVSDFANCCSFEVNTIHQRPAEARLNDWGYARIQYGSQFYFRPESGAAFAGMHVAIAEAFRAYYVNSYFEFDYQDIPGGHRMILTNRAAASVNAFEVIHCQFNYINASAPDFCAGFDYNVVFNDTLANGTGSSQTAKMVNSIMSTDSAAPENYLALTNQATSLLNNAFFNLDTSTVERGYSTGVGTVTLSEQPGLGTPLAALLAAGSSSVQLSHDIHGRPRRISTPDIGPEDYTSSVGYQRPMSVNDWPEFYQ